MEEESVTEWRSGLYVSPHDPFPSNSPLNSVPNPFSDLTSLRNVCIFLLKGASPHPPFPSPPPSPHSLPFIFYIFPLSPSLCPFPSALYPPWLLVSIFPLTHSSFWIPLFLSLSFPHSAVCFLSLFMLLLPLFLPLFLSLFLPLFRSLFLPLFLSLFLPLFLPFFLPLFLSLFLPPFTSHLFPSTSPSLPSFMCTEKCCVCTLKMPYVRDGFSCRPWKCHAHIYVHRQNGVYTRLVKRTWQAIRCIHWRKHCVHILE